MTLQIFGLILLSVTCSAFAQFCLKLGMKSLSVQHAITSSASDAVLAILTSPAVVGGLTLYGLGALIWLSVLARIDVSIAYPFVSISFLLTAALAVFFLGEPVSRPMLAGTSLIVLGVAVLARG
jgi:multidrug transporter EmrE-like cation transporter